MAGRPTVMTPEVQDAILMALADGVSIRQICMADDMPSSSTVYLALANDREFSDRYVRAREAQMERFADEILEIADDGTNDWRTRQGEDGGITEVIDHEHIARSRLRVDSRKWLMARLAPKKYGDRITQEISGKDGGAIEVSNVSSLDRAKALAALVAKAKSE